MNNIEPSAPQANLVYNLPEDEIRMWLLTAHLHETMPEERTSWSDRLEAGPLAGYAFADIQLDRSPAAPLLAFTSTAAVIGAEAFKSSLTATHNATNPSAARKISEQLFEQFQAARLAADPACAPAVPSAVRALWADLGAQASTLFNKKFVPASSWDEAACAEYAETIVQFVKTAADVLPFHLVPLVLIPVLSRLGQYSWNGERGSIADEDRRRRTQAVGLRVAASDFPPVPRDSMLGVLSGFPLVSKSIMRGVCGMAPLSEEELAQESTGAPSTTVSEVTAVPSRPRGP